MMTAGSPRGNRQTVSQHNYNSADRTDAQHNKGAGGVLPPYA